VANPPTSKTAQTRENRCRWLRPVVVAPALVYVVAKRICGELKERERA
jgi:hypothetical protein